MKPISDSQLDHLLKQSYPAVDVSPDFTLRLWRRLMKEPVPAGFGAPRSLMAMAAGIGVAVGLWRALVLSPVVPLERLDLFGNAPRDSIAGTFLTLSERSTG